jgi:hypothetical protein
MESEALTERIEFKTLSEELFAKGPMLWFMALSLSYPLIVEWVINENRYDYVIDSWEDAYKRNNVNFTIRVRWARAKDWAHWEDTLDSHSPVV